MMPGGSAEVCGAPGPVLEVTYSTAQVGAHLGLGRRAVGKLLALGLVHRGLHPVRGGLWPTFRPHGGVRRIAAGAVLRHVAHLQRLETDAVFLAAMRCKARALGARRVRVARIRVGKGVKA